MPDEAQLIAKFGRADANRIAMRVARSILDAAHAFEFVIGGVAIHVSVAARIPKAWPAAGVLGLSPDDDGPWPSIIELNCSWDNGGTTLQMRAHPWRGSVRYDQMVGITVKRLTPAREMLWITLASVIGATTDGAEATLEASFTPFKGRDGVADVMRDIIKRAGIPFTSPGRVEAMRVVVRDSTILPSPSEVFERLVKLAVIKIPFFRREDEPLDERIPPFDAAIETAPAVTPPSAPPGSAKFAGLFPLPGGVRSYKTTLDALLTAVIAGPMSMSDFGEVLRARYDVHGESTWKNYAALLGRLRLCDFADGTIRLSRVGNEYLASPSHTALFERLHTEFIGILETLTVIDAAPHASSERIRELLRSLLGVKWESANQFSFRRNWLLSLALTDRDADGDWITPLGRIILDEHAAEVTPIREDLDALLEELGPETDEDLGDEVDEAPSAAGLDELRPPPRDEPVAWSASRVDLVPSRVTPFVVGLELPPRVVAATVAALSSGKHVLLVGPPGSGKTELAHKVIEAAQSEGYCAGAFVATASADWTTYDTIGGYALQKSGELRFRPGALLRAIEQWQWLLIDELNRADVDRAFGEMMTVLAGRTTDTSYQLEDGRTVRIGPDPTATHPMPRSFRVLATMNTWDKTSLFRLSYAVQRRFAIIEVGIPDDAGYARLVKQHAEQDGFDPALPPQAVTAIVEIFSRRGLVGVRPLGPALALDLLRFVRRRSAGSEGLSPGDAVAEALAMYVLPQLEGLDVEDAKRAHRLALAGLTSWSTVEARNELSARFAEVFPHVTFSS